MTVTWKTPGDGVQFIVTLSRDNASVYHHLSSFDGARYTYAQRLQPAAERSRSAHVSFYAPTTATDSSSKREITFDAIRLLYIYICSALGAASAIAVSIYYDFATTYNNYCRQPLQAVEI